MANTPINENIQMFTVKEVSSMLHIGINQAYDLVKTGKISAMRVGRSYRIPKDKLLKYIEENTK